MIARDREIAEMRAGLSRRDFLRVGGLGAMGMAISPRDAFSASAGSSERSVILLMLVGGPSQLETWDPKPDAPAEIRGPFASIATTVPGVRINEHLPRLATHLDRVAIVRSLSHDAAPIHETGHQLIQTGRLCRLGDDAPHFGSVVASIRGSRNDVPPFAVLPSAMGNTGVGVPHGQSAGTLGRAFDPFVLDSDPASPNYDPVALLDPMRRPLEASSIAAYDSRQARLAFDLSQERPRLRDVYGRNSFGQSCLLARRLVEAGVRVVTVNMYESVFNRVSWDCHGTQPFSTFSDYADQVLPTFDAAFSALVDDLDGRGLLESTLVVATGEFGRTPRINASGGRDHWPGVWSALLAGGGIAGGQVLGSSDAHACEPVDRPVTPQELLATIYRSLRIDPRQSVELGEDQSVRLVEDAEPVRELFA